MHNSVDQSPLQLTEMQEKYNDYIIAWATYSPRSDPGRWMGVFHARKDGAATISASIANLQDTKEDAREKAIELAKAHVDQAIAAKA